MAFDPTAFLAEFREEAAEHLRALDAQILKLERDRSDLAPIREMFLSAHSIKGGAAMLGLTDIRDLAHAVEDVLAHLRDGRQPLDVDTADLLFQSIDALRGLIDAATPGVTIADPVRTSLIGALHQRLESQTSGALSVPTDPPPQSHIPRVLLVEDSHTVRLLATMLLNEAGFQVESVVDGQKAASLALSEDFDLLITSVETQGLRGLDLAAMLRATGAQEDLPIIVMTNDDNPDHRRRAAELGVQAYIRKGSFGQHQLVETARKLLNASSAPTARGQI